jgi:branched-chain amino acid transport system ATP-binding protein
MALLAVSDLRKSFGELHAVDGVTLSIDEKQLVSLIGSNGAGKTTLVNLITGLLRPDHGRILFRDHDLTHAPVPRRIAAGIARSFQLVNLFDQLTALDNVRLAIFARQGKIKTATTLAERDDAVRDEAYVALEAFGIGAKAELPAGSLAQGERKLLDVAVAYALRPTFILLDEPTSGVGTREKGRIMDTVSGVVRAGGLTALIVEHDMDVVFRYSDRIIVMHQGQVLADGTPEQIRQDERVATTLMGRG